jgi:acetoin utilization protein AcuB
MSAARARIMLMPDVSRYMTPNPYALASTDSVLRAKALMQSHAIRHLPVIDGGRLVGILSERDTSVIAAIPGVDLARVEVGRVMEPAVHARAETSIDEVAELMAEQKRDCVVVMGGRGVEGIFTATDAFRALVDLVRRATA